MRRTWVLALAIGSAAACAKESNAPKADVKPAPAVAPAAAPVAGERLKFDASHGKIEFVGSKVTGSHDGGFREFEGTVTVPDGGPELGAVEVRIRTESLWVDNAKLQNHLKSPDFFDVARFPEASFASSRIAKGADGRYTLTGTLELHGVRKEIAFPAELAVAADKVTTAAEFKLNRKDFGLVYPGAPDDLIKDDVVLRLRFEVPRGAVATTPTPAK